MPPKDVLILGAGPTGLAAAIALAKTSTTEAPLRITIIELRPNIQTIGGAVNLTPLALRYLDSLGAGSRLRPKGCKVQEIDVTSLRTGQKLGSVWGGADSLRVLRQYIVESLWETVDADYKDTIEVKWGLRVSKISEDDAKGKVILTLDDNTTIEGDLLLGCDGIHSTTRRLWVEPEKDKIYSGRVVATGFIEVPKTTTESSPIWLAKGKPVLKDTLVMSGTRGTLLCSYYEPSRTKVYFGAVMAKEDISDETRDGWKAFGSDRELVKKDIVQRYQGSPLKGVDELLEQCEEWNLYPVYKLAPGGIWNRSRVLLLGDAAHAMPPQGESTGYSIEDGVLFAHVFQRRDTRSLDKIFADYELLRRNVIDKHYKEATFRWDTGNQDLSWFGLIFIEWLTWIFLIMKGWGKEKYFDGDVKTLELPA